MTKRLTILFLGVFTLTAASAFSDLTEASKGTTLLRQISEAFTELADHAIPATVSIKCIIGSNQSGQMNPHDMFQDEFFRRFFGPQFPQQPQEQTSGGSGFIIGEDGFQENNTLWLYDPKAK